MGIFKKQGVAVLITVLMIAAAVFIGRSRGAQTPAPEPGGSVESAGYYVYDEAGVLSAGTEEKLSQRNRQMMQDMDVVTAVVTCNYGGDDLYSYAMDYAGSIGLSGYDFIVVLDISGENYWLLQGADLVDRFSDQDCSDYAYEYMERDFARRDYDGAVLSVTQALMDWYYSEY